eukprot:scaffold109914_cov63-Phaeocystis_antarctica.AAC.1
MVPHESDALSTPQKRERRLAGTNLAATACSEGTAAASPAPITARMPRSAGRPAAAAAGEAACAALHTTRPPSRTDLGEVSAARVPEGSCEMQ